MEYINSLNFILSLSFIYLSITWVPLVYKIFISVSGIATAIKFAEWLMTRTRQYILHKNVRCENKAVLITGCDSGFGQALVKRMYSLGYTVFAACLFPEGDGAMTLKNNYSEKMKVFQLDVTDNLSIEKAKEFVINNLGQNVLWAVVNNAGIFHFGEMDWVPLEDVQKVFSVNTLGMLRVTKAFLPFLKESQGRIINVTSLAGRHTFPSQGVYAMSKSGANSLTTALRLEMAKWGVKAISIEPSLYSTNMANADNLCALVDNIWKTVPDSVKDEYGECYIESHKSRMLFILNSFVSPDVSDVIDCLEDAITAQEPLPAYLPYTLSLRVLIWLLHSLPLVLREFFVKSFMEKGHLKPSVLLAKKKKK